MASSVPARPPQFEIRRPCAGCPFAPGGVGGLGRAFLEEVLDSGAPSACHQTTTDQGRDLNHPRARYCAGHRRLTVQERRPGVHLRLGMALGLWHPERDLDPDAPLYGDRAALFRAHEE